MARRKMKAKGLLGRVKKLIGMKSKTRVKARAPRKTYFPGGLYQIGKSDREADRIRRAKKPGKRTSASGNAYWEHRRNRTDVHNKRGSKGRWL